MQPAYPDPVKAMMANRARLVSRKRQLEEDHKRAVAEIDDEIRNIDMASGWNRRVQKDFDTAVKSLAGQLKPLPDGTYPWLDGSSTAIYELKKAAMALDGQFYDFANHALLVNQAQYFTTVLTSVELSDILQNPEHYAAIEVSPK